jgi:hypothetical protein
MTMTLLQTVQEYCARVGLDNPQLVMASQDDTIRQIRSLANEVITDICNRGESWPRLRKEATFVTLAAEIQGTLLAIAPYGFKYIIPGTMFNRTLRVEVLGPKDAVAWQAGKALSYSSPYQAHRIWQGNFCLQPNPTAGQTVAFEYASDFAILGADGVTWQRRFVADGDIFQLDEELLIGGLRWKWRREKGLSYAQEKSDWEALLAQAIGNDGAKPELNMGDGPKSVRPGVFVSTGSWNL